MLRRSNVIPRSAAAFSSACHLRRSDIVVEPWGLALIIRWSKTVQFNEKTRRLPLPAMPGHALCPVQAVIRALATTPQGEREGPAFTYLSGAGRVQPLTSWVFNTRIRKGLTAMGLDCSRYASHSFRRGAASWAYDSGLSVETIRQMGDWKTYSCLAYIALPDASLLSAVQRMQSHFSK